MNYNTDPATHPELAFPGPLRRGDSGPGVRRVQEWLCLADAGVGVAVDGIFGPATEAALSAYTLGAAERELSPQAWARLTAKLRHALAPKAQGLELSVPQAALAVARVHLSRSPREVGGQNRGPWVRTYMDGCEGPEWPWCAGFVSFVLAQACRALGVEMPIAGSFSCDELARQAARARRLVSDAAYLTGHAGDLDLSAGCIFLVRGKAVGDWTHTGFAFDFRGETFATIEGNTNDDGSREGFEVCARQRAVAGKDFIRLD